MQSILVRSWLLIVLDLAGLYGAYNLAYMGRLGRWLPYDSIPLWILIMIGLLTLYVMGVYRVSSLRPPKEQVVKALIASFAVGVTAVVTTYLFGVGQFTPIFGRGVLPVAMVLFAAWAALCRWIVIHWIFQSARSRQWYLISNKSTYDMFARDVESSRGKIGVEWLDAGQAAGTINNWTEQQRRASRIIIDTGINLEDELYRVLQQVHANTGSVFTLTSFYEEYWMKLPVFSLKDGWLIRESGFDLLHDQIGIRLKRIADVILAVPALVVTSPIMLLIGLLIRLDTPGKVIYRQKRVGRNGKVFTLYQFRSKVDDAEKVGAHWASVGDPRITRIGKFLRATRLDELPQLWNLLIGNMSLIGPRPERPEFVEKLSQSIPFYTMRHLVPPGLTGWAQVMYPYGSSEEDAQRKLEYDLYYIKNHSVGLDLAIVLKTILVVIKGLGR